MAPPDPTDVESYDEELAKVTIGEVRPLIQPIEIRDYDPDWPRLYALEEVRIRSTLGERVIRLEHAGSTSVPGLPAKPLIDIVLEVPDSADEPSYVPDLEAARYVLRIREPDWFEHRLFKGPDTNVSVHTFSAGCEEVDRMLLFRDWLRESAADRELYAAAKRDLAARDWKHMQQYADAKTDVVTRSWGAPRQPRAPDALVHRHVSLGGGGGRLTGIDDVYTGDGHVDFLLVVRNTARSRVDHHRAGPGSSADPVYVLCGCAASRLGVAVAGTTPAMAVAVILGALRPRRDGRSGKQRRASARDGDRRDPLERRPNWSCRSQPGSTAETPSSASSRS